MLSFALVASLVSRCFAQEPIAQGEVLTLQKCLQIALARHPDVLAAGRRVESEIARTGQVAAADRIKVDASASYARRSPASAVERTYDRSEGYAGNPVDGDAACHEGADHPDVCKPACPSRTQGEDNLPLSPEIHERILTSSLRYTHHCPYPGDTRHSNFPHRFPRTMKGPAPCIPCMRPREYGCP